MASQIEVDPAGGRAVHVDAGRDLLLHHRHPPHPPAVGHPAGALPLLVCHRLRPAASHLALLAEPPFPFLRTASPGAGPAWRQRAPLGPGHPPFPRLLPLSPSVPRRPRTVP